MKIAQICPYDIDRPGGVQTHIRDTAVALQALGHHVVIVAPKVSDAVPPPSGRETGVRIVRIGAARKIGLGATNYEISLALGLERRRLDALMREEDFDVVHFHTMWTPLLPFQVFRRSRAANVATFHDTAPRTPTGAVLRALFRAIGRRLLPRLDAVVTVSPAPLEHLSAARGVHVHIVPPCTDLRRFAETPPSQRKHTDGRIDILFLGRLEKRKGAMLLLQAYRRLCADNLPVRLLIAGGGEDEPMLRHFVREHGLTEVEFIGAFDTEKTPGLYAGCDIFCAPSPYGESFGIVVAEAMASGKPVVAAANAGYRTLLTGEAARFLTPPGDADAIYDALRILVLDRDLRARLGAWGRKEAQRYDCRAVAPQLVAIYEQAIEAAETKRRHGAGPLVRPKIHG